MTWGVHTGVPWQGLGTPVVCDCVVLLAVVWTPVVLLAVVEIETAVVLWSAVVLLAVVWTMVLRSAVVAGAVV